MKTKKILSLLLAGILALSVTACGEQQTVTNDQDASSTPSAVEDSSSQTESSGTDAERPSEPSGQLVIGSITQVLNEFYDTGFSTSETNFNMYDLIHGSYDTVIFNKEGEFQYNDTVVASHEEAENEDGSKTYTIAIKDGLVWSDGTAITAKGLRLCHAAGKQRRDGCCGRLSLQQRLLRGGL